MSLADYSYDPGVLNDSDDGDPGPSNFKGIKRGSRACDRCRKLKSKCEATSGNKCKNCATAGTPCTYQGPSFKRGPPKGYIHAIEQRWHQVECILGSLMAIPQAQNVVSQLRADSFANSILDRVDSGPYGPRGRALERQGVTSGDFYATIMGAPEASRDDRRVRRQSRMTREIVSSENPSVLATPTKDWQDQLIRRLSGGQIPEYPISPIHTSASPASPSSSSYRGISEAIEPGRQRRRLEGSYVQDSSHLHQNVYEGGGGSDDSYSNWDELDDTADSFGHLALDDHKEIRYHGHASGLPLLARSDRAEDSKDIDGLWKFPTLKEEARSEDSTFSVFDAENDPRIALPSLDIQRHLVQLYFIYVHPFFPVIHKSHFLANFPIQNRSDSQIFGGQHPSASERMPMQKINKLLLLAMFSVAARYADQRLDAVLGEDLRAIGVKCAIGAREILNNIFQYSRPATVQALLLLGIREFGIGSMEQGWLYTGMALRMAVDLGMNRNADNWKDRGRDIFTPVEKQLRKQIWWSCCITDKLSAMWMGRPITFRANDYSTLKPDITEEDNELWRPYLPDALGPDFMPRPAMTISCYREQCELSMIITDIMDQIYPVRTSKDKPRRQLMQDLEYRLHHWSLSLPQHLRYSPASATVTPLSHVLVLHIEYYAAVLLLHRAFIPHANGGIHDSGTGNLPGDTLPMKSFDICQSAAANISAIVTVLHEKYGLDRAPSFLSIYLQSAGIMHVITLTRRPHDAQATLGLKECIDALRYMEGIWPSATRVRKLLEGVKVLRDEVTMSLQSQQQPSRHKRSAEEALGAGQVEQDLSQSTYEGAGYSRGEVSQPSTAFEEDTTARLMMQTLGLNVPGLDASPSYYGGYQFWPHSDYDEGIMRDNAMDVPTTSPSTNLAEGEFSFCQQQLVPEFVQGVHYPILDPSNLFPQGPHPNRNPRGTHGPGV